MFEVARERAKKPKQGAKKGKKKPSLGVNFGVRHRHGVP
jgi:hypothetical protein